MTTETLFHQNHIKGPATDASLVIWLIINDEINLFQYVCGNQDIL